jgi:uncharacterized membrane protein YtjA (UPF0391 family)
LQITDRHAREWGFIFTARVRDAGTTIDDGDSTTEFSAALSRNCQRRNIMLHYALVFLVIALIAAVLGFGGIAGAAAGIAKILFLVFIVLFVVSLIGGSFRRGRP